MAKRLLICCAALLTLAQNIYSYPELQLQIPNGNKVPSPCKEGETWQGVGHESNLGSGPLNPFGRDFLQNSLKWTTSICKIDSDGDGKTNGEELGDPNCVWLPGAVPAVTNVSLLSHPGVCEPLDSPKCAGKINFLQEISACAGKLNTSHWCPAVLAADVKSIELRFSNDTVIPSVETTYFCQTFKVPADDDYHIIGWESIIDNVEFSHHMLLFACDSPAEEATLIRTGNYSKPVECGLIPPECPGTITGWAVGVKNKCYFENQGLRMGKSTYRYVIVQIHYNNPNMKKDNRDSSGIRLYYTTKLRQYDVSTARPAQRDISIPPGSQSTRIIGRSFQTEECSRKKLEGRSTKYNVSALLFHMHKSGYHAKLTLEKKNGQIVRILDEPFFYDQQRLVMFGIQHQPVVEPGDSFVIECYFQTKDKKAWTFFGKNTADEMCLVGIDVYPRPSDSNHIELGSYGMNDMCMIEKQGAQNVCKPAALATIIQGMKNDTNTTLWSECGPSLLATSNKCCTYLNDHQYLTFPCVYTSSYQVVRSLLDTNKTVVGDINKVHGNIMNCITAVQMRTITQQEAVKSPNAADMTRHSLISLMALFLCALFCSHLQY